MTHNNSPTQLPLCKDSFHSHNAGVLSRICNSMEVQMALWHIWCKSKETARCGTEIPNMNAHARQNAPTRHAIKPFKADWITHWFLHTMATDVFSLFWKIHPKQSVLGESFVGINIPPWRISSILFGFAHLICCFFQKENWMPLRSAASSGWFPVAIRTAGEVMAPSICLAFPPPSFLYPLLWGHLISGVCDVMIRFPRLFTTHRYSALSPRLFPLFAFWDMRFNFPCQLFFFMLCACLMPRGMARVSSSSSFPFRTHHCRVA